MNCTWHALQLLPMLTSLVCSWRPPLSEPYVHACITPKCHACPAPCVIIVYKNACVLTASAQANSTTACPKNQSSTPHLQRLVYAKLCQRNARPHRAIVHTDRTSRHAIAHGVPGCCLAAWPGACTAAAVAAGQPLPVLRQQPQHQWSSGLRCIVIGWLMGRPNARLTAYFSLAWVHMSSCCRGSGAGSDAPVLQDTCAWLPALKAC